MSTTALGWKKAGKDVKYCKFGDYGLQGAGKTYTMAVIARQIARLSGLKTVYMLDSEGGSDYVAGLFEAQGMTLSVLKTREFGDLVQVFEEASMTGQIVVVDSITHFWNNVVENYMKARTIKQLRVQDWQPIFETWRLFTKPYVNSQTHGLICGRVGYEYDTTTNEETGKLEFYRTDTKMKAGEQFGHEPALLFHLLQVDNALAQERLHTVRTKEERAEIAAEIRTNNQIDFVCTIEKDRTQLLQGQRFIFTPTPNHAADEQAIEDAFLPVIAWHLKNESHGGIQESGRTQQLMTPAGDEFKWQEEKRRREIALEELEAQMVKWIPGQSGRDKALKGDVLEKLFKTRSWTKVCTYPLDPLEQLVAKNPPGTLSQVEYACQDVLKAAQDAATPVPLASIPEPKTNGPKNRVIKEGAKT